MIDIVSNRCACGSLSPCFGLPGKTPTCCKACKTEDMVDVRNIRCACGKQMGFGLPGGQAVACFGCKTDAMIDLRHELCLQCGDVRANPKYRGHCVRCFIHTFPDEPVARNHKTKERAVQTFLQEHFGAERTLVFDRRVDHVASASGAGPSTCDARSARRPDVFIDMGEFVVIVEIDEDQHESYDATCENKRVMQIFMDAGRRPMVVVRFNPDDYTDEHQRRIKSPWGIHKTTGVLIVRPAKRKEWQDRLDTLRAASANSLEHPPAKELTTVHLFYSHVTRA